MFVRSSGTEKEPPASRPRAARRQLVEGSLVGLHHVGVAPNHSYGDCLKYSAGEEALLAASVAGRMRAELLQEGVSGRAEPAKGVEGEGDDAVFANGKQGGIMF